jgi:hypothetical protein
MALCEMASVDVMCINAETSAESLADTEIQPPTASGMNAIEVRITWNASLPVPSDAQEELLIRSVLLPEVDFTGSKKSILKSLRNSPLRWKNLSAKRQAAITKACTEIGVNLKQV